ncbi:hypothetical protein ACQEUX_11715 [Micromonospora sp. CA-259024]|uniref:hypothetical protein n=1 Tax=Micromonospora sp. CA-259024 TaxID=3239965 RepID=UPI003D8A2D5D
MIISWMPLNDRPARIWLGDNRRASAGAAAFRRAGVSTRLFTLARGQVGRYRANFRFRFTDCACDPSWYYEDRHVSNGDVAHDRFLHGEPDSVVDNRFHLHGGPAPR